MRRDYAALQREQAEVLVVGPDSAADFRRYWESEELPFRGLPDPRHQVADLYRQEVNWLRLGRMPALLIIDRQGRIVSQHYGDSMRDIPDDRDVLELLATLNREEEEEAQAPGEVI